MNRLITLVASLLVIITVAGCGKYVPVEGVVRLDGKPLAEATVSFVPAEFDMTEGGPRDATALSDMDGNFRLRTGKDVGAIPGNYKVLVSKRVPPKGLENPKNVGEAIQATQQAREILPEKYTNPKEATLLIDIPSGGVTDLQLLLESK